MSILYLGVGQLTRGRHVAPPCFYSSTEQTNLTAVRVFIYSGRPGEMHLLEDQEEEVL